MKRLVYIDQSIITDDRASDAVMEYAQLLASHRQAAVISLPALSESGEAIAVDLLIGPASQLVARPTEATVELDVDAFVANVRARMHQLQGVPFSPVDFDDNLDLPA